MITLTEDAVRPPHAVPEAGAVRADFETDLTIDEFDGWTNPENATVSPTTMCWRRLSTPTALPAPRRARTGPHRPSHSAFASAGAVA
ncbi:hypothetical protein HNR23_004598 [Nocardiopsis mwathae]|uniref:Uncharacterized protein n=1 Tax=Nocardiopsis mwathae TaxID=1472723 RepID=A0A7W9YLU6_9ACTN|nr:hypothetical protein [Nocardiopsis mwathae]MBB6174538.1 hypothetical protein [Nocardiopsis mwathae]